MRQSATIVVRAFNVFNAANLSEGGWTTMNPFMEPAIHTAADQGTL